MTPAAIPSPPRRRQVKAVDNVGDKPPKPPWSLTPIEGAGVVVVVMALVVIVLMVTGAR